MPKYKDPPDGTEISLSTPWDDTTNIATVKSPRSRRRDCNLLTERPRNDGGGMSSDTAQIFLLERTRLHETYIKEQERTKRIGIILSAVLIFGAAALILFAPAGRETLSYWIGAALVIFAAGTLGYQRVWGKTKNISFGADQDQRDL